MKNLETARDLTSLTREELEQQNLQLLTKVDELQARLSWYEEQYRLSRAQRFGPSSEQTSPFEQMSFFNEAESESSPIIMEEPTLDEARQTRKGKSKGQKDRITKSLPVETIEYRLSAEARSNLRSSGTELATESVSHQTQNIHLQEAKHI